MTTDLQYVARQFAGVDRTGGLTTLDEDHRADYIAGLVSEPVAVLSPTSALRQAFEREGLRAETVETVAGLTASAARSVVIDSGAADVELSDDELRGIAALADERDVVVVVGVRAPDGGASPAERLQELLPERTTLVRQAVANASVLGVEGRDTDSLATSLVGSTPLREAAIADVAVIGFNAASSSAVEVGVALVEPATLEELVEMNEALRIENRWLAQQRMGVHDAAAARAAAATTELGRLRGEMGAMQEKLNHALDSARVNDELFQEARLLLFAANDREKKLQVEVERHRLNLKLFVKWRLAQLRNRLIGR